VRYDFCRCCPITKLSARLDDPVDAVAVHGGTGLWGVLAVGIFAQPDDIKVAYPGCPNARGNRTGLQFGIQLCGAVVIILWAGLTSLILLLGIKFTVGLRVTKEEEEEGLDASEHHTRAYEMEVPKKGLGHRASVGSMGGPAVEGKELESVAAKDAPEAANV